mmetsp:Transcript_18168/g.40352  ORF Transcript_18168/g.40352 Transcript_18168/m.40352 type:complete len:236 (-) Transcript_18168:1461-2168(-)
MPPVHGERPRQLRGRVLLGGHAPVRDPREPRRSDPRRRIRDALGHGPPQRGEPAQLLRTAGRGGQRPNLAGAAPEGVDEDRALRPREHEGRASQPHVAGEEGQVPKAEGRGRREGRRRVVQHILHTPEQGRREGVEELRPRVDDPRVDGPGLLGTRARVPDRPGRVPRRDLPHLSAGFVGGHHVEPGRGKEEALRPPRGEGEPISHDEDPAGECPELCRGKHQPEGRREEPGGRA